MKNFRMKGAGNIDATVCLNLFFQKVAENGAFLKIRKKERIVIA